MENLHLWCLKTDAIYSHSGFSIKTADLSSKFIVKGLTEYLKLPKSNFFDKEDTTVVGALLIVKNYINFRSLWDHKACRNMNFKWVLILSLTGKLHARIAEMFPVYRVNIGRAWVIKADTLFSLPGPSACVSVAGPFELKKQTPHSHAAKRRHVQNNSNPTKVLLKESLKRRKCSSATLTCS